MEVQVWSYESIDSGLEDYKISKRSSTDQLNLMNDTFLNYKREFPTVADKNFYFAIGDCMTKHQLYFWCRLKEKSLQSSLPAKQRSGGHAGAIPHWFISSSVQDALWSIIWHLLTGKSIMELLWLLPTVGRYDVWRRSRAGKGRENLHSKVVSPHYGNCSVDFVWFQYSKVAMSPGCRALVWTANWYWQEPHGNKGGHRSTKVWSVSLDTVIVTIGGCNASAWKCSVQNLPVV